MQKKYIVKLVTVVMSHHIPSVVAVCLGATSLERHITLDRTMYGSDQAASLEKSGKNLWKLKNSNSNWRKRQTIV